MQAQNCAVNITGGYCTKTELTAETTSDSLTSITWFQYTSNVFAADTISSQASITTVAGNHGMGSSSNQFDFPAGGISVDGAGNVYVADAGNNRIQKWAPGAFTGVTVAGGNGAGNAANQLSHPKDVFVDANGNIYVADAGNSRIQKWIPGAASGVTVAGGSGGSSPQQLNGPSGVYVDAAGNIFIADTYNYRVQRWAAGAHQGVTVAGGNGIGTGDNQFSYPVDVYLDGAKNIYVADANTENSDYHRVQKWKLGATSGTTVAGNHGTGTGDNQFGYLLAIYVDAAGNLYTTDNGVSGAPVSRVQKWIQGAAGGITVAGGHSSGWDVLSYPTGVALDSDGLIYVLDGTYNPRVQKYLPTNGIVENKFTPSYAGSYTVQAVFKNGCTAQSPALIVRAIPPTPQILTLQKGGRGNLCEGGIHTFYVSAPDDITKYAWKIPITCSLAADKNDSVIISVPAGFFKGLLQVKGTNVCGTSAADTLVLIGKPVKPIKIIGPRYVFDQQANITYSVEDVYNNRYNWSVPQDATIVAGQGSTSVIVNWGATAGLIGVSATNDCGTSPSKEVAISVKRTNLAVSGNAIVYGNTGSGDVRIFPNPAMAITTLLFTVKKQTKYTIEIQDLRGRILMRKELVAAPGANTVNLDVSRYASGMYFVHAISTDQKLSLKLSKE